MKTKTPKLWYIKERDNGQTGVYYVALGQLSKAAANRHGNPLAGHNVIHGYDSEADYIRDIERFKNLGFTVQ